MPKIEKIDSEPTPALVGNVGGGEAPRFSGSKLRTSEIWRNPQFRFVINKCEAIRRCCPKLCKVAWGVVRRYPRLVEPLFEIVCSSFGSSPQLSEAAWEAVRNCPKLPGVQSEAAPAFFGNFPKMTEVTWGAPGAV